MKSLFTDNYWGRPGYGDCDCFTITACAVLLVNGYKTGYTLYGNGAQPTHIAADVYLFANSRMKAVPFDLTAPEFGRVRSYLWQQNHVLRLSKLTGI